MELQNFLLNMQIHFPVPFLQNLVTALGLSLATDSFAPHSALQWITTIANMDWLLTLWPASL